MFFFGIHLGGNSIVECLEIPLLRRIIVEVTAPIQKLFQKMQISIPKLTNGIGIGRMGLNTSAMSQLFNVQNYKALIFLKVISLLTRILIYKKVTRLDVWILRNTLSCSSKGFGKDTLTENYAKSSSKIQ